MAYTPGQDYTNQQPNGNFPGSRRGQPPSGLSKNWENAVIVTAPGKKGRASTNANHFTKPHWSTGAATPPSVTTVGQMLLEFDHSAADSTQVVQLQNLLQSGGYLKKGYIPGEKDSKTRKAFIAAMEGASRSGLPFGQFLDGRSEAGQQAGVTGSSAPKALAELSDPAALHKTLDEAAYQMLGRRATASEKELFTATIHRAQQQSAGQQLAAQADSAGGVKNVTTVSPDAQAEDFVKQMDPTRYDARQVVANFDVVAKMFGGR